LFRNNIILVSRTLYDGYVLLENRTSKGDRCASLDYLCDPTGTDEEKEHPACDEWREERNGDDKKFNDIPPDGDWFFCDNPQNLESSYYRVSIAPEFCLKYPEYKEFCKQINHQKLCLQCNRFCATAFLYQLVTEIIAFQIVRRVCP
jgi:hypothetical protein